MTVYVDDMRAPFGKGPYKMILCHMIADSSDELLAMADRIGMARRWIQEKDTAREHFDIGLGMKKKAIAAGAVLITQHELARRVIARRALKAEWAGETCGTCGGIQIEADLMPAFARPAGLCYCAVSP